MAEQAFQRGVFVAVRRLCARLGVPVRTIDLDSAALQRDGLGGRLRAALTARTGIATIPQVFAGGELLGGATDVIEAAATGHLQSRLAEIGVPCAPGVRVDPGAFLPSWIHPR